MKDFILKHPIVTWLIIDEICSTIKTCVLGKQYHSWSGIVTGAGATAVNKLEERTIEELTEDTEEKETVVTGFHPGN